MRTYETFELIAKTTWRLIRDSEINNIRMGEDAITSYNLTAIAASGPMNVVYEDTRIDESTKGCDFELWVGSTHLGWYRYAIQAKKIKPTSGKYEALGHKVNGTPQIAILKKYASANNATPLYCFYNYADQPPPSNCSDPYDHEQLGCTIAPISVVEKAIKTRGGRTFSFIHKHESTLPWRCLVKCPMYIPGAFRAVHGQHKHTVLPGPLNALRNQLNSKAKRDFRLDPSGLFSKDIELRPAKLIIVDIEE